MRLAAVVMCGLMLGAPASADTARRVRVQLDNCRPAPASVIDALEASWLPWRQFIQLCPVRAPNGHRVLSVLTVRIDLFQAAYGVFADSPASSSDEPTAGAPAGTARSRPAPTPIPRSSILDPRGRVIGELPSVFPGGFPGETRLFFADWRSGFPRRVEMREINAAAHGSFDQPPLVWSDKTQRYEMLVSFNEKDCIDPSAAMLATLDAKWPGWRQREPAVQACPIFSPDGEFVLDVLIPRRELSAGARGARLKPGWARPAGPEPALYILDPQYRGLGEAPVGPPAKGSAGTVTVLFTNWRNGFPNRVEVHAIIGGVSQIYGSPLGWNAATHEFESVRP